MEKKKTWQTEAVSDDVATRAIGGLETTVDTFSARLQRRLRERELREDACQKLTEERHARILQAMSTIRRALQETCKIELGRRFKLELEVGDWEGWPRLDLALVDAKMPQMQEFVFSVSAHDRKQQGTVLISLRSGELLGRLLLADAAELSRIPVVLKKTVRIYLDRVAEYVLNPVRLEETLEEQTRALKLEEEDPDPLSKKLGQENVFADDLNFGDGNTVEPDRGRNPLQSINFDLAKKPG